MSAHRETRGAPDEKGPEPSAWVWERVGGGTVVGNYSPDGWPSEPLYTLDAAEALIRERVEPLGWVVVWWKDGRVYDSSGVFWSPPDAEQRANADRAALERMWASSGITFTVEPVGAAAFVREGRET